MFGSIAKFKGDDGTNMTLYKDSITIKGEDHPLIGVTAELLDGSQLQSRVTATRLILIGVLAFAMKKKKGGEKYLTVSGPDFMATAEAKPKHIKDAIGFMTAVNNQARQQKPPEPVPEVVYTTPAVHNQVGGRTPDEARLFASDLEQLTNDFTAGKITLSEFQARKNELQE